MKLKVIHIKNGRYFEWQFTVKDKFF